MGSKYHLKSNRQTSSAMAEAEEQYRAAGKPYAVSKCEYD